MEVVRSLLIPSPVKQGGIQLHELQELAKLLTTLSSINEAVLLTGGAGIGLMIAQALEANGAIVYIIGRRKESLEKAAATAVCYSSFPTSIFPSSHPCLRPYLLLPSVNDTSRVSL